MPITIYCPDCDARIRAPSNVVGRQVKCPRCQKQFIASDTAEDSALSLPPLPEADGLPPPPPEPPPSVSRIERAPAPPPLPPAPAPPALPPLDEDEDEEEALEEDETRPPSVGQPNVLVDFLLFRRMIAPAVIQILFWLGVFGCLVGGAMFFFTVLYNLNQGAPFKYVLVPLLMALATWFLGPLVVRLQCELLMVFFRIYDTLREIRDGKSRNHESHK